VGVSDAPEQLTFAMLADAREDVGVGRWSALSHKEQLFVAALLSDPKLRQTQAAIAAGFAAKTAGRAGSRLANTPHIKAAIDAAMHARVSRINVTADRVLREVDTVSLSTIEHYTLTEDGQIKLAEGAPPDAMRAISGFKRKTRVIPQKDGEPIVEHDVEFKLWSKPDTLRLSMQHRGMLGEKPEAPEDADAKARAIRDELAQMDLLTLGAA
jgi:phage terminase small subunit